jgi:hypothetical protein
MFGMHVVVTDLDRDGFAEIVVGAPWESKVYVFAGSRAGPRDPARQVLSCATKTWFPDHMVAADFDADGYGDIAITDHGGLVGHEVQDPMLTVYRGSPVGLSAKPELSVPLGDLPP